MSHIVDSAELQPSTGTVEAPRLMVVRGLQVRLGHGKAQVPVLEDIDLDIGAGRVTCLLGESGSGKTMLVKTLLGIQNLRPGVVAGSIVLRTPQGVRPVLEGLEDYVGQDAAGHYHIDRDWPPRLEARFKPLWGAWLGYVPQHGVNGLDPTRPVGASLEEALCRRDPTLRGAALREEVVRWLERLRLEHPDEVRRLRPAQLSGGMAQRAVIALALARGARVLFADEPTSGLDPEAQDALLELLEGLRADGLLETLVLVTHDLEVARRLADDIVFVDQRRIREKIGVTALFEGAGPVTSEAQRLLGEYHRISGRLAKEAGLTEGTASSPAPRLTLRGIAKGFFRRVGLWRIWRPVLVDADLEIHPGEIVGLVGPSGSGKTTLAGVIARLLRPDRGKVSLDGEDWLGLRGAALQARRRFVQVVFQQVAAAIHPQMTVEEALLETAQHVVGLEEAEARQVVNDVLEKVQLGARRHALAGELSGGQLRRVGVARAWIARPAVLLADEPTAGIDASLRAGILDLLFELARGPDRTAILLISHDRQVIGRVADRIVALRGGRLSPMSLVIPSGHPPQETAGALEEL